jgi:hypothetical protein
VSDDMNMSGEGPIVPEGTVAPLPAPPLIKPGMARRNVLLIVAGVIVLVALVGFVYYAIMIANNVATPGGGSSTGGVPVTVTPGTPTGTSTTPTAALPPISDVTNRDIFTPRNPFAPIKPISIAQPAAPAAKTTSSHETTHATSNNSDTLTLQDIVTENSVRKAVVSLNGTTYTLAAGEQVGTSNWSIVEVNASDIVARFGDITVTLLIGQGSSQS